MEDYTFCVKQQSTGTNAYTFDPWPRDSVIHETVHPITDDVNEQWKTLIDLFPEDELIWVGTSDQYKSDPIQFRTKREWRAQPNVMGKYICPCTFKTTQSLGRNNVQERRFHVVVPKLPDGTSSETVLGLLRWMCLDVKLVLRCIIEKQDVPSIKDPTPHPEYQAWFDYPPSNRLVELRRLFEKMPGEFTFYDPAPRVYLPQSTNCGVCQIIYLNLVGLKEGQRLKHSLEQLHVNAAIHADTPIIMARSLYFSFLGSSNLETPQCSQPSAGIEAILTPEAEQ